LFACGLTCRASGGWFGDVAIRSGLSGLHLSGAGHWLCGPSAQRVAKAEEDRTEEREGEEDAKDGSGPQRDLTVLFDGFVKIMVGVVSSVQD
jgi:hypothetical protein